MQTIMIINKTMNKIKFMAFAAIAACTLVSCGKKDKENETDKAKEIPQVKIADVVEDDIAQTEVYTATVESDVKNNISPNVPYRIEKIYVEVGQPC